MDSAALARMSVAAAAAASAALTDVVDASVLVLEKLAFDSEKVVLVTAIVGWDKAPSGRDAGALGSGDADVNGGGAAVSVGKAVEVTLLEVLDGFGKIALWFFFPDFFPAEDGGVEAVVLVREAVVAAARA